MGADTRVVRTQTANAITAINLDILLESAPTRLESSKMSSKIHTVMLDFTGQGEQIVDTRTLFRSNAGVESRLGDVSAGTGGKPVLSLGQEVRPMGGNAR